MSRRLDSLVADIADDASVDWEAAKGTSSGGASVDALRIVAAIGLVGRDARSRLDTAGTPWWATLISVVAALALLKLAVTIALTLAALELVRVGPRGLLSLAFGVCAVGLLVGGRSDARAGALGGVFALVSVAFVEPYLRRATNGDWPSVAGLVRLVPLEAFLGVALWAFAWVFPSAPQGSREGRWGRVGIVVSTVVALCLFVANVSVPVMPEAWRPVALPLARLPGALFWVLVGVSGLPALGYLVWKSRRCSLEDRSRTLLLSGGLAAGLGPFAAILVLAPVLPGLSGPSAQKWVGVWLYLGLALTVVLSAYAVLVRQVVDVHFLIRRALQHRLAKQLVWAGTIAPLVYVAAGVYLGRKLTVTDLADDSGLVAMSALGLGAVSLRKSLLRGVDHWFRLEAVDYSDGLARFTSSLLAHPSSMRMLEQVIGNELVRTLHAKAATLLILNADRSSFVETDSAASTLSVTSSLAQLAGGARRGVCVDPHEAGDVYRLLPLDEQQWVRRTSVAWLFPLHGSLGSVIGILCVSASESGIGYTERDRTFVAAIVGQSALHLENQTLRQSGPAGLTGANASYPDWRNEPAAQCQSCLVVGRPGDRCACGGPLQAASVPMVLSDKFHVERVLGAGGMGVVYLAVDMTLNRRVAIKAMPRATSRRVARLEREAQAMALVRHPNLAMIFSVERWRDAPLLVVEYFEGGTLLDALREKAQPVEDVLDLGIVLADALDRMHGNGLLHRDIKPSNIGFTAYGVPKLLDFGLAAMLQRADDEPSLRVTSGVQSHQRFATGWSPHVTRSQTHLVGTPMYVSPEAIAGDEPDVSFDLWSLSMVLYEAIAGRHPLAGYPADEAMRRIRSVRMPDVRDSGVECPPAVAAFLNDALAIARERRPSTAADLRACLQSLRASVAASGSALRSAPLY